MKVAFLMNSFDASHVKYKYGIGWFISKSLEKQGLELKYLGGYKEPFLLFFKMKQFLFNNILKRKYWRHRETFIIKNHARQYEKDIQDFDPDVVFGFGSLSPAYLETDKPLVFWTDATFGGLLDFYEEYSGLSSETIAKGHEIDRLAIENSDLVIFSSEWARDTAIKFYNADPAKLKVLPFGPNLVTDRSREDIDKIFVKRDFDTCRLLFLGREWERKGGDIALKISEVLNKLGVKCELHVVGCEPETEGAVPDYVIRHGFINKNSEEGSKKLDDIFEKSHFLVMFSRAEATPHVFSEANSFGMPCIASDTGGIPSVITNDRNGRLFPLDVDPETPAQYISNLMSKQDQYKELALSSFNEYKSRLNWNTSAKKIKEMFEELMSK